MKAYFSLFKMRLINGMQYRVAALAGIATQFFWGFMFIMVYEAFYDNAVQAPPIALDQLVSYIWLQQAFLAFIALWYRDGGTIQPDYRREVLPMSCAGPLGFMASGM